jgi:hypothetical protein
MARHRKIPGKKHKGVKDPEKQRAKREKILRPMVKIANNFTIYDGHL